MKEWRVAIERTYRDVSIQYVTADGPEAAKVEAYRRARHEDEPSQFGAVVELAVIECEDTGLVLLEELLCPECEAALSDENLLGNVSDEHRESCSLHPSA